MKKLIFIFLSVFTLYSCENPFPEFKSLENDTYMQLISFEEGGKDYANAAFVKAEIVVYDGEKLIFHNFFDNILSEDNHFDKMLVYLNEGDSAVFKINQKSFLKQIGDLELAELASEYITVHIKIHQYYTKEEYLESADKFDNEMLEQIILKKYLIENEITPVHKKQNIYIVNLRDGNGATIKNGDVVVVNYKAHFVNYVEFDNTYKDIAFTFIFGAPDQVIEGLYIALKGKKVGEKLKIIIPSQSAFGEEGSSTGIVPPFATVIYDLEIVKIKE